MKQLAGEPPFEFNLGDVVYRKVDDECMPGLVTGIDIQIRQSMTSVRFQCSFADGEELCWAMELSTLPVPKLTSKDE